MRLLTAAALTAALALPALAQGITVAYDPDRAMSYARHEEDPRLAAESKKWGTLIAEAQAGLSNTQKEYQSNALTWSEAQQSAKRQELVILTTQFEALLDESQRSIRNVRDEVRGDFQADVKASLAAYAQANTIGDILLDADDEDGRSLIVLTPEFDISVAVARMLRDGPDTAPPEGPNRPPVIRYIRTEDAYQTSRQIIADNDAYMSLYQSFKNDMDVKRDKLNDDSQRAVQAQLNVTADQKALMQMKLQAQSDALEADFLTSQATLSAQRKAMLAAFKDDVAYWLESNPDAAQADIVRFIDDDSLAGSLLMVHPDLDLTETVADAFRQTSSAPAAD